MTVAPRAFVASVLVALTVFSPIPVQAQGSYPNGPIKIVVPFPPGGLIDALTRMVAEQLVAKLGQPVIVDNKPGASGNVGAELVANAKPDGYTLLSTPPPPLVINQSLFPRLPFDPAKFVPITILTSATNVLIAHPKVQADNAADLIAQARAYPGKLNYASTGNGGTPHVTTEWFKSAANIEITHIPYQGVKGLQALLACR